MQKGAPGQRIAALAIAAIAGLFAFGASPAMAQTPDPIMPDLVIPNVLNTEGDYGLGSSNVGVGAEFCSEPTPTPTAIATPSAAVQPTSSAQSVNPVSYQDADDCLKRPSFGFTLPTKKCQPLKLSLQNPNASMTPVQVWMKLQPTGAPVEATLLAGAFLPAHYQELGYLEISGSGDATVSLWFGLWHGKSFQIDYGSTLVHTFRNTGCAKKKLNVANNDGSSASNQDVVESEAQVVVPANNSRGTSQQPATELVQPTQEPAVLPSANVPPDEASLIEDSNGAQPMEPVSREEPFNSNFGLLVAIAVICIIGTSLGAGRTLLARRRNY